MSTIDAAIIKALVEHIGGDSSGIPDGTIGGGGKTYTAGDGITINNNVISVSEQEIRTDIINITRIDPIDEYINIEGDVHINGVLSIHGIDDLAHTITDLINRVDFLDSKVG